MTEQDRIIETTMVHRVPLVNWFCTDGGHEHGTCRGDVPCQTPHLCTVSLPCQCPHHQINVKQALTGQEA